MECFDLTFWKKLAGSLPAAYWEIEMTQLAHDRMAANTNGRRIVLGEGGSQAKRKRGAQRTDPALQVEPEVFRVERPAVQAMEHRSEMAKKLFRRSSHCRRGGVILTAPHPINSIPTVFIVLTVAGVGGAFRGNSRNVILGAAEVHT